MNADRAELRAFLLAFLGADAVGWVDETIRRMPIVEVEQELAFWRAQVPA